jgi:cytochrome c
LRASDKKVGSGMGWFVLPGWRSASVLIALSLAACVGGGESDAPVADALESTAELVDDLPTGGAGESLVASLELASPENSIDSDRREAVVRNPGAWSSKGVTSMDRGPGAMGLVHEGTTGLLAGRQTHSRYWVLASAAQWSQVWNGHLAGAAQAQAMPDVDFRRYSVLGVAAWGPDVRSRVRIVSVSKEGPRWKAVYRVDAGCPENESYADCAREPLAVHQFVAVPRGMGTIQFFREPGDEPRMTWNRDTCGPETKSWAVDGRVCRASITEQQRQGGLTALISETSSLFGVKWFYCRRNALGALQWMDTREDGLRSESCDPVPPPPPPPPVEPEAILRSRNCLMCHALDDRTIIGPSFPAIAAYYRGSPPPVGYLEQKISRGGGGVFGSIPMPSQPQISESSLAIVVPWILSR